MQHCSHSQQCCIVHLEFCQDGRFHSKCCCKIKYNICELKIKSLWNQNKGYLTPNSMFFILKLGSIYPTVFFFFFFHATVFHWEPTPQDGSEHGFWVENAQNRASFQHDEMHGLVIYITYLKFTIIIYIERKIFGSS